MLQTRTTKVWKAAGVSVRGFSHIDSGVPCQDAHAVQIFEHGFVAAVADGAGSARYSERGASLFVDKLVYASNIPYLLETMDEQSIAIEVKDCIYRCREQLLLEISESDEELALADFAATLMVAVSNGESGFFFHIGDGAAAAFPKAYPENAIISKPENGQYANETYFVTMNEWEQHLRVSSFCDNEDTFLLMSDGVTPMAMTKGNHSLFEPFISPVNSFLEKSNRTNGEAVLVDTLSSEQVKKITGDDKTFVWCQWIESV